MYTWTVINWSSDVKPVRVRSKTDRGLHMDVNSINKGICFDVWPRVKVMENPTSTYVSSVQVGYRKRWCPLGVCYGWGSLSFTLWLLGLSVDGHGSYLSGYSDNQEGIRCLSFVFVSCTRKWKLTVRQVSLRPIQWIVTVRNYPYQNYFLLRRKVGVEYGWLSFTSSSSLPMCPVAHLTWTRTHEAVSGVHWELYLRIANDLEKVPVSISPPVFRLVDYPGWRGRRDSPGLAHLCRSLYLFNDSGGCLGVLKTSRLLWPLHDYSSLPLLLGLHQSFWFYDGNRSDGSEQECLTVYTVDV